MYSSFTPEVINLWSVGHIQPAILFCMARELKVFTFLKGYLGKKKKYIQHDCMTHKVKNIYYLAIHKKSLPAPTSHSLGPQTFFRSLLTQSIF